MPEKIHIPVVLIDSLLRKIGYMVVFAIWDGRGEWQPTRMWIERTKSYEERTTNGDEQPTCSP